MTKEEYKRAVREIEQENEARRREIARLHRKEREELKHLAHIYHLENTDFEDSFRHVIKSLFIAIGYILIMILFFSTAPISLPILIIATIYDLKVRCEKKKELRRIKGIEEEEHAMVHHTACLEELATRIKPKKQPINYNPSRFVCKVAENIDRREDDIWKPKQQTAQIDGETIVWLGIMGCAIVTVLCVVAMIF